MHIKTLAVVFNADARTGCGVADLHRDNLRARVLASGEASNQTTNGSTASSDNSASEAGAAYVFVRSGGVWSQQAYLKASARTR